MNDPAFFEIAQGLSERILKEGPESDEGRITLGIQLCLAREPGNGEVPILKSFLNTQRKLYANMDAVALTPIVQRSEGQVVEAKHHSERAAWVMLARVLLNLDETITRE